MKKRFSKFFGTRQFYKLALAVAVPLMMQQLITSSVNLVDNLMVGQLGDAALGRASRRSIVSILSRPMGPTACWRPRRSLSRSSSERGMRNE